MRNGINLNEGESEEGNKGEVGEDPPWKESKGKHNISVPADLNVIAVDLWPGHDYVRDRNVNNHTHGGSPVDIVVD